MNSQINSKVSETNNTIAVKDVERAVVLHHLPKYLVCIIGGMLSGAVSVALVIGLAIVIQALLPPSATFAPHSFLLALAAALTSLSVSWMLSRVAGRHLPGLFYYLDEQGLRVMFISSAFTSLLETFIFILYW